MLTDWPGGGFVGVHGTNEPSSFPGYISHGCIRLPNDAIVKLSQLMNGRHAADDHLAAGYAPRLAARKLRGVAEIGTTW